MANETTRRNGGYEYMSEPSIEQRVSRGAEWLDAVRPGWEQEIDLGRLTLHDACRCVLGQIIGQVTFPGRCGAVEGFHAIDQVTNTEWLCALGFTTWRGKEWGALDEAWIALLKERFSSGNLSALHMNAPDGRALGATGDPAQEAPCGDRP